MKKKIPIECCLFSNINTMKLRDGLVGHPVLKWFPDDHPFVLCTDNPGILNVNLSQHYQLLKDELGLSDAQLWKLSENAINYIFDENVKIKLLKYFKEHPSRPLF